ncbi:hypothetical protein HYX13_01900 [Candidatus Woesearchaeota archaeon]|nr:hypothetical protein [Candidatus Woesearchaeota archaeon]
MHPLTHLTTALHEKISSFSTTDHFLLNNHAFSFDKKLFQPLIFSSSPTPTIAFIDGGQAELIVAGNFCVSFIRVAALIMQGEKKILQEKKEFFLLTTAKSHKEEIWYESKIFSEQIDISVPTNQDSFFLNEQDLFVSSQDPSLKSGTERAPITRVAGMARRFAELFLAAQVAKNADFLLLDGTLEKTYSQEEKYLQQLPKNSNALAKSSSLFTTSGNGPSLFLQQNGPSGCWNYQVKENISFVKLHEKAKHVFRFEGTPELLPFLLPGCTDATFLGYPYGLILADQLARVSNEEKKSLQMRFMLDKENKDILEYLTTSNAHDILDGK